MKICFVGPAQSAHIIKWCNWFAQHGHEIHVISFTEGKIDNATVHVIDAGLSGKETDLAKIKYLFHGRQIKKCIQQINPDIVNVHFATSYGASAALGGLQNYILSVWGSDVYDFPKKSIFHKLLLKFSLKKASYLFSTSKAMAEETRKYCTKEIYITPFGVDVQLFSPSNRSRDDHDFVIGTVKTLSPKYGIEYLLKAAAKIHRNNPDIPLKVRIAGKGTHEAEYKELAKQLDISNITEWLGFISQPEAAHEWANMDVAVIPSTLDSESFGVSAVEAQSCGVPVIISDVPGLMEATQPDVSSIVVPRKNEEAIYTALVDLYNNPQKRKELGENGRLHVCADYEYNQCFERIEQFYRSVV